MHTCIIGILLSFFPFEEETLSIRDYLQYNFKEYIDIHMSNLNIYLFLSFIFPLKRKDKRKLTVALDVNKCKLVKR